MANNTPGSQRPWLAEARRKPRKKLTPKMVKYSENRSKGMTPIDAAKATGYASPHSAALWLESSNSMTQYNRDMMAVSGVTPQRLFDKVAEKLDAKRSVYVLIKDEREFVHPEGTKEREEEERKRGREPKKELVEEDDNHAQHKFLETAVGMMGLRPEVATKLMIESQLTVDITHHVQPVIPDEMMKAWESMTPDQKLKAVTTRARQMLTGTLQEDPVDLQQVSSAVSALPPSNVEDTP